jgi:hypothetical protein
MLRFVMVTGGLMAGVAALIVWRDRQMTMRPMPVKQAADLLRQAWADHHTRT